MITAHMTWQPRKCPYYFFLRPFNFHAVLEIHLILMLIHQKMDPDTDQ